MDVTLPNGVVIKGVPDGMSKDEVRNKAITKGLAKPEDFGAPPVGPSGFSAREMVKNIPASAVQFGKDIVTPITSPAETAAGMKGLALGFAEKASKKIGRGITQLNNALVDAGLDIPRIPNEPENMTFEHEKAANQLIEFMGSRYGSIDKALKTLEKDPVGMLADVSLVMTGAGAPLKTGKLSRAGVAIDPVNLAISGGRLAAGKLVPKAFPAKLYESAAKLGTTIPREKRASMVKTALEHRITPTTKGIEKLDRAISKLGDGIDGLISAATAEGKTVPVNAVFKHFGEARKKLGGPKLEAVRDLKIINRVAKAFRENTKKLGKTHLTPDELQAFKVDAYKRIDFDRKQGKAKVPKAEAYRAAARAAKELIEEKAPGVKGLNVQMGKLLELRRPLEKSASRIENLNVIPLTGPLNIAAGGVVGGAPGAAVGTVASMLEAPTVKARTAMMLQDIAQQQARQTMLGRSAPLTLGRQGLFQAGRYQNN